MSRRSLWSQNALSFFNLREVTIWWVVLSCKLFVDRSVLAATNSVFLGEFLINNRPILGEIGCHRLRASKSRMAAVQTRADPATCSLNILAGAALDSREKVIDIPLKRKRPSSVTHDVTYRVDTSHKSISGREEQQNTRRAPTDVESDPMLMASDHTVTPNSRTTPTL